MGLTGRVGDSFVLMVPAGQADRFSLELHRARDVPASSYELLLRDERIDQKAALQQGPNPITVRFTGKPVKDDQCELIVDYFFIRPYRNFIRDWMVIGPFHNRDDKGLDKAYPPEQEINVAKSYTGKGGKTVTWKKVSKSDGLIFLQGHIKPGDQIVAYGACRVISPNERATTLLVGSDDGVKVWLNGKLVHSNHAHRGLSPDQDRVQITLRKGANDLLVKIDQGGGPFGFAVRISDPQEQLQYALPE